MSKTDIDNLVCCFGIYTEIQPNQKKFMNNSNKNEDFSFSYVAPVKYFADISLQEV
jgi:hypothetical protein